MSDTNTKSKEQSWIPEFVRFLKTKGSVKVEQTMSQSPMQVMAECLGGTSKHAGIPLPNPALMMAATHHPSRHKSYSIDSILGDIVTRKTGHVGDSGQGPSGHSQLQLHSWVTRQPVPGSISPPQRYSPERQQPQSTTPNSGKFKFFYPFSRGIFGDKMCFRTSYQNHLIIVNSIVKT